ncbi:MAG: histidine phosphatase family protein [Pseudomonadota bacterium]
MIFLRHPRPEVAPGICYGRTDIPVGPGAPAEIAAALAEIGALDTVLSSPSHRCLRLAEPLARRDGLRLRTDERLMELDFGAWEMRPWDEIPRAESDPWAADPWRIAPPEGESFAALYARVAEAITSLSPRTAIVTHAGPIRAARMILTGRRFDEVFAEPVPYATPIPLVEPS